MFVGLLAGLFLAQGKWVSRNARHGVVAALLSAALALLVAHLIAGVTDRPRPFAVHPDVHLFVAPTQDASFPSDHATAGFAIAVSILLRSRRIGWLAVAMAAIMSVGRVAVGVHYPSDVLAGALLGSTAALVFWLPPIRGPLHRFADRCAGVYDEIAARIRRRAPAPG